MSKAEALKGMADDVKSAAKGAAAYAKRGSIYALRCSPLALAGKCRAVTDACVLACLVAPGVGYPPPPVMAMGAELAEGSSRTKDAQPEPKDEWREYVRGVVYGGLVSALTERMSVCAGCGSSKPSFKCAIVRAIIDLFKFCCFEDSLSLKRAKLLCSVRRASLMQGGGFWALKILVAGRCAHYICIDGQRLWGRSQYSKCECLLLHSPLLTSTHAATLLSV